MSEVVGILLAAGRGERFGADKRLHSLDDGTPMLLASARHLAEACDRTLVVLRPGDATPERLLAEAGLESMTCSDADKGMGHSLACAVRAAADATGWLIALADMPFIQPSSYRSVLEALRCGARIARPLHAGRPGHPVGFAAACFSELSTLTGDRGGQAILARNPNAVELCRVDDPGVIKDIDRPGG